MDAGGRLEVTRLTEQIAGVKVEVQFAKGQNWKPLFWEEGFLLECKPCLGKRLARGY